MSEKESQATDNSDYLQKYPDAEQDSRKAERVASAVNGEMTIAATNRRIADYLLDKLVQNGNVSSSELQHDAHADTVVAAVEAAKNPDDAALASEAKLMSQIGTRIENAQGSNTVQVAETSVRFAAEAQAKAERSLIGASKRHDQAQALRGTMRQ